MPAFAPLLNWTYFFLIVFTRLAVPVCRAARSCIGGREYFTDMVVGCRNPLNRDTEQQWEYESIVTGCGSCIHAGSAGRRTSRGILLVDFGLSWRLLRDRPFSDLLLSRLPKTLQLMVCRPCSHW